LKGDSGEEVALWLLTSLCTSAKREVEVALLFYQVALLILTVKKHRYIFTTKISVFQTAIVKGRNRNSYEYKNCTTDPNSGKITSVLFHFIYLGFDGGYPKGLLTLWI
jgi:hypothetical protein